MDEAALAALNDRADRLLAMIERIASAVEGRAVAPTNAAGTVWHSPPTDEGAAALTKEMTREEGSLQWADKQDKSGSNTTGLRERVQREVLILWFASLLCDRVKTNIERYTQLFEACEPHDVSLEAALNKFKAGTITPELISWARLRCSQCFSGPNDTKDMIRKFHDNMQPPPPTA